MNLSATCGRCESNGSRVRTIIRGRARTASSFADSVGSCPHSRAEQTSPPQEALTAAETLALREPQNRDALYLVAANQRCLNQITEALTTLERLEQKHPNFSLLFQERGHCCMTAGDATAAIHAFLRAVNLNPALTQSWTMLERLYRATGEPKGAVAAHEQVLMLENLPPEIVRAGSLFF